MPRNHPASFALVVLAALSSLIAATTTFAATEPCSVDAAAAPRQEADRLTGTDDATTLESPEQSGPACEAISEQDPEELPNLVSTELPASASGEGARCRGFGESCRRTRDCCAPLRCAFDGYAFWCRH